MKRPIGLISIVFLATLPACGEIAYKRGAGADELNAAQQRCRKNSQDDAYQRCMETEGWTLHRMDAQNPLMVVVPVEDNRAAFATPYVSKASVAPPMDAAGKPLPPNPLEQLNVSSWWKAGGSADELDTATAACVAALGPAHQPESATRMTRGLVLCLKKKGWLGLQGY